MSEEERARFVSANVDLDRKELTVQWGDGHVSLYALGFLRKHCPCAACRAEREKVQSGGLLILSPAALHAGDSLQDIAPVGRYGMQPIWADGHSTGIFTFEFLRDLCPCTECRRERA